jgi:hypothetical protein
LWRRLIVLWQTRRRSSPNTRWLYQIRGWPLRDRSELTTAAMRRELRQMHEEEQAEQPGSRPQPQPGPRERLQRIRQPR